MPTLLPIIGMLLSSQVSYTAPPDHLPVVTPIEIQIQEIALSWLQDKFPVSEKYVSNTVTVINTALQKGVDPNIALQIADRESSLNPNAIGDHGTSYGMWQIHLPAHKDITKQQALDPDWSTAWAINQLKAGNCHIWSTCKNLDNL